ncbi:DUF488 domain-containing protein [Ramlibacter sp.]|uniref:DUF488 domain-containing protein n=1 Tax=Ramlibacter sp. TaxID=1917967 RepID=UPI002D225410|nr:DUF488 domain-containing protein [Ramlibacter sp.]HYD75149.1 DUF488 domain-containing protein [Ramlibacter sp.]
MSLEIWTVGHSTRSAQEFLSLLQAWRIEALADVRRFPGSRKHPQFGADALAASLQSNGIAYAWLQKLGGRRRPDPASPNVAWRNESFRAYADHLATPEFAEGLAELLHMASACRTAIMCSELVWWRCHRGLIADALLFSGIAVTHILDQRKASPHPYTPPARAKGGELVYSLEGEPLSRRDCC